MRRSEHHWELTLRSSKQPAFFFPSFSPISSLPLRFFSSTPHHSLATANGLRDRPRRREGTHASKQANIPRPPSATAGYEAYYAYYREKCTPHHKDCTRAHLARGGRTTLRRNSSPILGGRGGLAARRGLLGLGARLLLISSTLFRGICLLSSLLVLLPPFSYHLLTFSSSIGLPSLPPSSPPPLFLRTHSSAVDASPRRLAARDIAVLNESGNFTRSEGGRGERSGARLEALPH